MPKPRLSYDTAQVKGAVKINRGRFESRKTAPTTTGEVGSPPKRLSSDQKTAWIEITTAIPSGIAGASDRVAVEMAAVLLAQFRSNPIEMQASRIAILMQLLSRLGLDPQARTRLNAEPADTQKVHDEWTMFEDTQKSHSNTRVM